MISSVVRTVLVYLAVLPPCAEADSLADLEMETQRACTQIEQVRQSFFSGF